MNTITTTYNKYNQPIYNIQNHQVFKGTPLIPSRSCLKIIGPRLSNLISIAVINKKGDNTNNAIVAMKTSNTRLK